MRFPKELSKERLSLLSPEELAVYESEHPSNKQEISDIFTDVFENDLFTSEDNCQSIDVSIEEQNEHVKKAMLEELDKFYDEMLSDVLSLDEMEEIKQNIDISSSEQPNALHEAEGQDAFAWIRGLHLGWLGTAVAAGLGALSTAIAFLLIHGKDRLAMEKLKYYMNRLVEITDQGVKKKRPWYSFLIPSKNQRQNIGEYNMGCFRTIQETSDRNMTNAVMSAAHKLGYFNTGDMMSISNAEGPQPGSGLDAFRQNVISQLNVVIEN